MISHILVTGSYDLSAFKLCEQMDTSHLACIKASGRPDSFLRPNKCFRSLLTVEYFSPTNSSPFHSVQKKSQSLLLECMSVYLSKCQLVNPSVRMKICHVRIYKNYPRRLKPLQALSMMRRSTAQCLAIKS